MLAPLFDDQADHFDGRAGLPMGLPCKLANAISELGNEHDCERILEIGPGTGELGIELMLRFPRYLAMDLSFAMLQKFGQRTLDTSHLIQADASAFWPLKEGTIDLVFGARSLHHIPPAHVLSELNRLRKNRSGLLVIGQKIRDPDSTVEKLRRKLHEILGQQGFKTKEKEGWAKKISQLALENHHVGMDSLHVHRWSEKWVAEHALLQWASKRGLAGIDLPALHQTKILQDLRIWAKDELGDLSLQRTNEVDYRLQVFSLSD